MKKNVKLTETRLRDLISKSVSRVLNEGYNFKDEQLPNIDADQWNIVADRFRTYAQEIEMFIQEFETFFSTLQQATQKLGLVLVDADNDGMNEENPVEGQTIQYTFTDGTNPQNFYRNDEAYEAYADKLEQLASELEDELNPRAYRAMQVTVRSYEEITVDVVFRLWE